MFIALERQYIGRSASGNVGLVKSTRSYYSISTSYSYDSMDKKVEILMVY